MWNKHLLVSKGQTRSFASAVKNRIMHPKLIGADVYVMRLARSSPQQPSRIVPPEGGQQTDEPTGGDESDGCGVSPGSPSSTGSLHDEVSFKGKNFLPPTTKSEDVRPTQVVAESRPCYRCISYMYSVGIKRVFWTNSEGKWEGAKVRDLVDQLEGTMASPDDTLSLPVFVTKHEVLLLRRLMTGDEC